MQGPQESLCHQNCFQSWGEQGQTFLFVFSNKVSYFQSVNSVPNDRFKDISDIMVGLYRKAYYF